MAGGRVECERVDKRNDPSAEGHAGVDTSVIALWFGHESTEATQIYLHGDMAIKERALARVTPLGVKPGRYRRPTRSSPSSRTSDYAEQTVAVTRRTLARHERIGITRESAWVTNTTSSSSWPAMLPTTLQHPRVGNVSPVAWKPRLP